MDRFGNPQQQPAWVSASTEEMAFRERAFFRSVYGWMFVGLLLTAAAAVAVTLSTAMQQLVFGSAISLPGEITFISSIAPIAMALGVPIAPLALLVAVEMIPDIFRTLGNVTFDVAVTAMVDRDTRGTPSA